MHQKQCISLLLSGALFASLCTGCSQTTMEHHFFTDSVTETEINTEVVGANLPEIEELQNIFNNNGIKLNVYLCSNSAYVSAGFAGGGATPTDGTDALVLLAQQIQVTSETLSDGIEAGMYVFNCGDPHGENNLTILLSDTQNAINKLCNAFEELQDDDGLIKELTEVDKLNPNWYLLLSEFPYSQDNKYYFVAVLARESEGTINWK